jgi:hypothetical protein
MGRSSSPGRGKIFSSPGRPDRFWGSPSLLSNGYRGVISREVKVPGREAAAQLPPSIAEVKITWIYTATPPYVFMA